MPRLHLFEFHELDACPQACRDAFTDFMSFHARRLRPYRRVAPLLAEALREAGTDRIVDLCSGAGSPLLTVAPQVQAELGRPVSVTLTDLFPNREAFRVAEAEAPVRTVGRDEAVDARAVPAELRGFRTIFTSFHHFRPADATGILADAARNGQGIGVFEYTERSLLWVLPLLLLPLFMWVAVPFLRPFRWRRLLWTYLLPVVPLIALWDGFVSCLRTYSPRELVALAGSLGDSGCRWRVGRAASIGLSRVTYLIGTPER